MAGIGFELRKIYGRKTLASSIGGSIYATMTAVGPSVIVAVLILFLKFAMDRQTLQSWRIVFLCRPSHIFF